MPTIYLTLRILKLKAEWWIMIIFVTELHNPIILLCRLSPIPQTFTALLSPSSSPPLSSLSEPTFYWVEKIEAVILHGLPQFLDLLISINQLSTSFNLPLFHFKGKIFPLLFKPNFSIVFLFFSFPRPRAYFIGLFVFLLIFNILVFFGSFLRVYKYS